MTDWQIQSIEWISKNSEWIFSGIGVASIAGIYKRFKKKEEPNVVPLPQQQTVSQTVSINLNENNNSKIVDPTSSMNKKEQNLSIDALKKTTSILFIDDDKTFKIVDILKKMGWNNTKLVKDVDSISNVNITTADVLFIDIQGVGKLLQLKDEGLGLALAIKRRFKEKKIIIYSAQESGARFHEALSEADYSLPKTADPVRFEETIIKVLTT